MVRRFLLTAFGLFSLGVVILFIASSRKRDVAQAHEPRGSSHSLPREPTSDVEAAALVPSAAADSETRRPVEQDAARIPQETAELRANMIAGVSRRPLFFMAKQRGVSCGLFVATKW